jgi:hypothetical protein
LPTALRTDKRNPKNGVDIERSVIAGDRAVGGTGMTFGAPQKHSAGQRQEVARFSGK